MLRCADPVGVERLDVLRIGLAAPLEEEAGRGRAARGNQRWVDRSQIPVGETSRLGNDRDHGRRKSRQVGVRLPVGDVDQLVKPPRSREMRGCRLEVGRGVAGQILRHVRCRGLKARERLVVDEKPPHLLERNAPDEILDVDSAIAERTAVTIRLGDLGLECDNAFEARLELAHRSPRFTQMGRA